MPLTLASKQELQKFLELNSIADLPGLNIQEPWCGIILNGKKIIETRGYDCPSQYVGKIIGAVATQRSAGPKSALTGLIRIKATKQYLSENDFGKDVKKHLVDKDSQYWFSQESEKWGWEVEVIAVLREPLKIKNKRGIVWSRGLLV
jgi:hypothetical protein